MPISPLGWPEPYLPGGDPTGSPAAPLWSKSLVIVQGLVLANRFLNDRAFANRYLDIVKSYYADMTLDLTANYAAEILQALSLPAGTPFNANDFANLHRTAWLFMLESFVCLVNKNPHKDWGDPPPGGVGRGEPLDPLSPEPVRLKCFHNIPNRRGYYGVGSSDLPYPPPAPTQ